MSTVNATYSTSGVRKTVRMTNANNFLLIISPTLTKVAVYAGE